MNWINQNPAQLTFINEIYALFATFDWFTCELYSQFVKKMQKQEALISCVGQWGASRIMGSHVSHIFAKQKRAGSHQ
ncbi:MAG: hypothetical protein ACJAXQ_000181 [Parvibaculaceae bacterium]|jgi:hypothetical protein